MQDVHVGCKPTESLNGVSAVGAGTARDLENCFSNTSIQTKVTGSGVTAVSVTLEGSLTGQDWSVLATSSSLTGDMQFSTGKPVRFVRANLVSFTATTIVVQAWVGASA